MLVLDEAVPRASALRRLYEDWRARLKGGRFPKRSAFDPADLAYILGGLSLFEVHREPLRFRCRVHGTSVAGILGHEFTGKFLDQGAGGKYLDLVRAHFVDVVTTERPSLALHEDVIDGFTVWAAEALVLPLSRDGDALDLLLSAVVHHKRAELSELCAPSSRLIPLTA